MCFWCWFEKLVALDIIWDEWRWEWEMNMSHEDGECEQFVNSCHITWIRKLHTFLKTETKYESWYERHVKMTDVRTYKSGAYEVIRSEFTCYQCNMGVHMTRCRMRWDEIWCVEKGLWDDVYVVSWWHEVQVVEINDILDDWVYDMWCEVWDRWWHVG